MIQHFSKIQLKKISYFIVVLSWLITMGLLLYRHHGYEKPSLDLAAQVSVPFNLELPPDISYLKVKVSGIDISGLELGGGRQHLKGDILEIRKEDLGSIAKSEDLKVEDEDSLSLELEKYIEETLFVQSRAPEIVRLAKKIVGDEKDTLKIALLINDWVYKNIKKVPTISVPVATEVLRTKQGDCNEHATLFTALSRAVDIPTRIAVGLVYDNRGFYYHAWPEVHIGKWVAVDPTLGQFPADASHVRLLTGDLNEQARLLTVIGKIKLKGLDYSS